MRFFAFLFFILTLSFSSAQVNMVPNPGFEIGTCPTFMTQWNYCTGWSNCNGNTGSGLWGTPDYYNSCGVNQSPYNPVPPNTGMGFCNPKTGNSMMGLVCHDQPYPNYREYISTQLSCAMTPGNTYTVSFWISASSAPQVQYNSSHFGVYLSASMPVQSGYQYINVNPQYEITSVISNTVWVNHTFTINPTSNLSFITLGCFRDQATITTVLQTPGAWQPYSNYFIDDIAVYGPPSMGIAASVTANQISCHGLNDGSATITPANPGTYTYSWSPGNYTSASVNNLGPGTYTVTLSNSACSSGTVPVVISEPATLSTTITAGSTATCDAPVTLTSTGGGGTSPYSVLWSTGANTPTVTVTPTISSVYQATLTDAMGCVSSGSISITVNNPLASFSYTTLPCSHDIQFSNQSSGAAMYQWHFGDGQSSGLVSPLHSYPGDGTYTVTLVAGSSATCIDSVQQVISIQTIYPVAAFQYSNAPCDGHTQFTNNSVNGINYTWNFGDGTSSAQTSPVANYNSTGTYTVSLVATSASGCKDTLHQVVSINFIQISPGFTYIAGNCSDSTRFINTTVNATSVQWIFDNSLTSNVTDPHVLLNHGVHQVILNAFNGPCSAAFATGINIETQVLNTDSIPNVFTPNEDGVNDVFDLSKLAICGSFRFEIYDRWGLIMMKSDDTKANFWNGRTTSGEKVPDGTYFYIIIPEAGPKVKGTVTIFR